MGISAIVYVTDRTELKTVYTASLQQWFHCRDSDSVQ